MSQNGKWLITASCQSPQADGAADLVRDVAAMDGSEGGPDPEPERTALRVVQPLLQLRNGKSLDTPHRAK